MAPGAEAGPEAAVVAELASILEIERIILFGSRASGTAAPRADIDLAVSAPGADRACWHRIEHLADQARTLLPIDLIWLEEASQEFRAEILRTGRVIYERR